jgi:IMP dehydrogenase
MPLSSNIILEGLTFDDVLLLPAYSEVLPREVITQSRISKNILLNVPFVSAAMDTVTESAMAIAMAREGGIGFLHKNMTIAQQVAEVEKVKNVQISGLINHPLTAHPTEILKDIIRRMEATNIHTFPVVDEANKFVGLISYKYISYYMDQLHLSVKDIMRSAESSMTIDNNSSYEDAKKIMQANKVGKLPVIDSTGVLKGIYTWKDVHEEKNFPNAVRDTNGSLRVGAALGVNATIFERLEALITAGVDVVCIDTAHGHSKGVLDTIKEVRKKFSNIDIIAGNVATESGAKALIYAGVDGVKVGVGPGSICTTRVVAGVGMPQLTAVMEAYKACKQANIPIIADGGIRYTGDVVKALAGGADTVMAGSIFAGTEESPGDTIIFEGRKFKSYRGMGSVEAMQEGSKDRYFQDAEDDIKKLVPEGIVGRVAYKGSLREILYQFIGGLKAGMGYCGAKDLVALKNAQFVKITSAGMKESHPHDVMITREAPNYSR